MTKLVQKHTRLLNNFSGFTFDLTEHEPAWFAAIDRLRQIQVVDSEQWINDQLDAGQRVLAEGAQGTLLDIDFRHLPFVTSSTTTAAGACTGLGVAPTRIGEVIGIFKAYCTRVGSGPFPTELLDETGEALRAAGHEFGATTGRPRRCGWLDLPALKHACMLNGATQLCMMKADVSGQPSTKSRSAPTTKWTERLQSTFRICSKKRWSSQCSNPAPVGRVPVSLGQVQSCLSPFTPTSKKSRA